MRISDWSSDVCSSDLTDALPAMTGAVHKLVSSIAPHSDEGVNLSRRELLDAKDDLRAAYDAIGALLTRIEASERGERSEERRVGKGWVSTCSSRWWPFHRKNTTALTHSIQHHITTKQ